MRISRNITFNGVRELWEIIDGKQCYYLITVGRPRFNRGTLNNDNVLFNTESLKDALTFLEGKK